MEVMEKVAADLSQICQEAGVCPSKGLIIAPGVKHAAELYKDGSGRVVRVVCWEDGCVSSCVVEVDGDGKAREEVCCYTAETGGEELYWAWTAHLCSPEVGYKERRIEVG